MGDAPAAIPTRRPDDRLAAERLPIWAELWTITGEPPPRRTAQERLPVEVIVHLFVQPRSAATTVERLADFVRETFEHRTVAIGEAAAIRFREAGVRDLSRDDDADGLAPRHLVVVVPGVAEPLAAA